MRHRRILLPAFGAQHSQSFADEVRRIATAGSRSWTPGETVALEPEMEKISFEAIMRVALGDEPPERLDRLRSLIPEMMRRCASPFTILPYFRRELGGITPYARLRRVLDELDEIFFTAIRERRAAVRMKHEAGDALSLLIAATDEDGDQLPEREIRDELLTLVMAGYETTTSALAWAFETAAPLTGCPREARREPRRRRRRLPRRRRDGDAAPPPGRPGSGAQGLRARRARRTTASRPAPS